VFLGGDFGRGVKMTALLPVRFGGGGKDLSSLHSQVPET
jgi:hypothetical protein